MRGGPRIHPDGIKDFGTQWDDHSADTYTATRLLMAFFCEEEDGELSPSPNSTIAARAGRVCLARIVLPSSWRKLSAKIGLRL